MSLEMGDISRFAFVKKAVSYCGLCGAEKSSGGKTERTPISKQRNKHLQTMLIEAAKLAPRWNTELALVYERAKQKGNRNRATLAVARTPVVGNRYVLTLEALNCATGGVLAGANAEAESKEQVLRALDDSTGKIRRKLGESLASIRKFGAPIEQATTGSLDALKMFALGDELRRQGKATESIPFFKRASELDPQFTLAYGLAVLDCFVFLCLCTTGPGPVSLDRVFRKSVR